MRRGAFANLVFGNTWILYEVQALVVDTVTGLVLLFIGEIETDPRMSIYVKKYLNVRYTCMRHHH